MVAVNLDNPESCLLSVANRIVAGRANLCAVELNMCETLVRKANEGSEASY